MKEEVMNYKDQMKYKGRGRIDSPEKGMLPGSYTVEAALVVGFFILLMAFTINYGFRLYQTIAEEKEDAALEDMDSVNDFYQIKVLEEVFSQDE